MKTHPSTRCLRGLLLALLTILTAGPASAATHTWKGSGVSTLWSYAGNWTSGLAPTAAESNVVLNFPATAFTSSVDDITGLFVSTMNVTGPGYVFSGLGGAKLTLIENGLISDPGLVQLTTISSSLPIVLGGAITPVVLSSGNLTILSVISGGGALVRSGLGNFTLGGSTANTFSGGLYCRSGVTVLDKTDGIPAIGTGVSSTLELGDPSEVQNVYLRVDGSNVIPDSIPISIRRKGLLTISDGMAERIGALTISGGEIEVGTSALTILTLGADVFISALGYTSTVSGPGILNLGGTLRGFHCLGRLNIQTKIADGAGGPGGINKTGDEWLELRQANTFTGPVEIHGGYVVAADGLCLGSTVSGTTISAGATLYTLGNTMIVEPLILQGSLKGGGVGGGCSGPIDVPFVGKIVNTASDSSYTLSGVISGAGSLLIDMDRTSVLHFSGAQANTMAGTVILKSGTLSLNKTLVSAIQGALTIQTDNPNNHAVVRYLQPDQLGNSAVVTMGDSLSNELNFDGNSDTIGSLEGGGLVTLGAATLTTGGNNATTEFHGFITGTLAGGLIKNGTGTFTIDPAPVANDPPISSTYSGVTQINNGTLLINDFQTGPFQVNGGFLGGSGSTGHISLLAGGHLCLCTLTTKGITGTGAANEIRADLTSPTNNQHITMAGVLSLTNTVLKVSLFYQPQQDTAFTLISNDGVDPVQGTFLGLANGANFTISGKPFTIFYNGGDGNDVVVIYKGPSPAPFKILSMKYDSITNTVTLLGLGDPGQVYLWERSLDLVTWTPAGNATANILGVINGNFVNGLFKPDRLFYRLVLP